MERDIESTKLRSAVIVVDVQNDFCPGGKLAVPDGDKVVGYLNLTIKAARNMGWIVVASRDWHPQITTHFEKWPEHCVQDTEGAKFHPNLLLEGVEIFSKGTGGEEDAYSAFDARCEGLQYLAKNIKLENFLKRRDVKRVYIGGLATDYCVKATAVDAVKKGFKTYLLTDAIAAVDLELDDGRRAMEEMVKAGVKFTNTNRLMEKYFGVR